MKNNILSDGGCGFEPEWHQPKWNAPSNVKAFVTYRTGGYSAPPFESNNLGLHVEDDAQAVEKNRTQLSTLLNLHQPIAWLNQVHGTNILTEEAFWSQVDSEKKPPQADGITAHSPRLICSIMTADCLPVLLCNKKGTQVAAIHAGWRGLADGIVKKAVRMLQHKNVSQDENEWIAYLGPAISQSHYEVGNEVVEALAKTVTIPLEQFVKPSSISSSETDSKEKFMLDMYAVARAQLADVGVVNVSGGDRCTYSEKSHFYSYRRDGKTGRMASLIWIEQ